MSSRPDPRSAPPAFAAWLAPLLAGFSRRVRPKAAALAVGALLAVGPRTVANCLRALGLADDPGFAAYHRVLSRNAWAGLAPARALLRRVVADFAPSGPVVIGLDHTLERRGGPRVGPAARFYDPCRRADAPAPTNRGLRWVSAMVLAEVPFARRVWALPVLSALTPGRAWSERHGRRHRSVTGWARLLLLAARRWLPADRRMVAVMDGEFAAMGLLHALRGRMTVVTRLRRDAQLYDAPPPPPWEDRPGRRPSKGPRLPSLHARVADPATPWRRAVQPSRASFRSGGWIDYAHGTALWAKGGKPTVPILWVLVRYPDGRREPEAFLCTDTGAEPREVLDWYDRRWAVETTYEEARAHLGVETQRRWSDRALLRSTPMLFGLYSVVALYAHEHAARLAVSPRRAAWYPKPAPTFADALARVRHHLWFARIVTSARDDDVTQPLGPDPGPDLGPALRGLAEAACYAP